MRDPRAFFVRASRFTHHTSRNMGFLTPAALGLLALAIPILIFYMLRLRRQPARVSSLLLWQKVLQDHQANAPWQRIRRNLLLLLQLLILLLVVLALARPYRTVEARVQGNVILLLDASASMQATDVPPTRFDAARAEAARLIRTLRPGDTVSLIAVADMPRPLRSGDAVTNRRALEDALIQTQPTTATANWETALALAAASAASQPNTTIVIISDGALPADLPTLPAPVRWFSVGKSSNNQAITALATRETRTAPELFLRVENFAAAPVEQLLEIYTDGQLFDARTLALPAAPDGGVTLTITNLPADAAVISARLTRPDDLPLDNTAAIRRASQKGNILLVGDGNLFLERAFSLLPNVTVSQAAPDQLPPETPFDLMIFDRTVPDTLPPNARSLLFIAPPQSTPLFDVRGAFTATGNITLPATDHPLLAFVNFSNLHVAQAQGVRAPWASPLVVSKGGSLLLAGEKDNRRVAVITFDLLKSDLPLQVDFPILVSNLARWLLNQPAFDDTAAPLNDNPLNTTESNIRPNQNQIRGTETDGGQTLPGRQKLWQLLAVAALGVLAWEWYVYWRGN